MGPFCVLFMANRIGIFQRGNENSSFRNRLDNYCVVRLRSQFIKIQGCYAMKLTGELKNEKNKEKLLRNLRICCYVTKKKI